MKLAFSALACLLTTASALGNNPILDTRRLQEAAGYVMTAGYCDDLCGQDLMDHWSMATYNVGDVPIFAGTTEINVAINWCNANDDCLGFGHHYRYDRVYLASKLAVSRPCAQGIGLSGGNAEPINRCYVKSVPLVTQSPTTNPTKSPTDSPTRTSWNIVLPDTTKVGDVEVDFSADSGAVGDASGAYGIITTKYTATAADTSAVLNTFLVDEECIASSSGSATTLASKRITSSGTCTATGASPSTVCTYQFDKSNMTRYNYEVATTPTLKVCEVAQLKLPVTDGDDLIVAEYFTNVILEFNTTEGFSVPVISMSPAEIQANTETTSLADYITASDCTGVSPLPPNTPLCIQISSSSADVLVEKIDEMDIGGNDPSGTANTLAVIDGGNIVYGAITSLNTILPSQTIQISTRVPTNQFGFEATGATIAVTGSVTIKFAGRRLNVDIDRLLQAANEEETASFDVSLNLARGPELALEGGEEVMMNSANAATDKAFAILGMVFASAFALW